MDRPLSGHKQAASALRSLVAKRHEGLARHRLLQLGVDQHYPGPRRCPTAAGSMRRTGWANGPRRPGNAASSPAGGRMSSRWRVLTGQPHRIRAQGAWPPPAAPSAPPAGALEQAWDLPPLEALDRAQPTRQRTAAERARGRGNPFSGVAASLRLETGTQRPRRAEARTTRSPTQPRRCRHMASQAVSAATTDSDARPQINSTRQPEAPWSAAR